MKQKRQILRLKNGGGKQHSRLTGEDRYANSIASQIELQAVARVSITI